MALTLQRLLDGPVYLIAEIGVNHGGQVDLARQMVIAAKEAGADAVKFQTFTADTLATPLTPKVRYQLASGGQEQSHHAMLKSLELSREAHRVLMEFCHSAKIDFLSTPYDIDSASFLHDLGVQAFKVASADLTDLPLLRFIASTGKLALVSTGMATIEEIQPVVDLFRQRAPARLALMHCVSNYPCSDQSLNLRALKTLSENFATPVGYSDHSDGVVASVAAVAMGATIVEKHFTLDRTLPGPDHAASAEPKEFARLAAALRRVETMLGSFEKACQDEERQMSLVSRKSVVLARDLQAGHRLTGDDLAIRRPGTGIAPKEFDRMIGRTLRRDLPMHHLLSWSDLE